jgi:hypothetical protein
MAEFSELEECEETPIDVRPNGEIKYLVLARHKITGKHYTYIKSDISPDMNSLLDREALVNMACNLYDDGHREVVKFTSPHCHFNKAKNNLHIQNCINECISIKLKLKDLITVHWSFEDKEKARVYPDTMVIEESPWVIYLKTGDTSGIEEFFYACRKTGSFPEDYWYDIKLFDKLVESIKTNGYDLTYDNNEEKNSEFVDNHGSTRSGLPGPIRMNACAFVSDGQHRIAALYYIYGPDYEIEIVPAVEEGNEEGTKTVNLDKYLLKESIPPPIKCMNWDSKIPSVMPSQKTFYIYVRSGLNNKIIPLMSLLRIARKENAVIKCYWGEDAYIKESITPFLVMFCPMKGVEFIRKKEFTKAFFKKGNSIYNKQASDRDRNEIIYDADKTTDGDSVFYKIVHCISYKDDAVVGKYVPYPKVNFSSSPFIDELRSVFKDLRLEPHFSTLIQNTVDEILSKEYVVGIHLRSTDGGFTDVPKDDIIQFIDNLFKEHPNYTVYISCDTWATEKKIRDRFPGKILFFGANGKIIGNSYKDKFDRFTCGTYNAACEMFLLSKCNEFYGTPGSSFSFTTWLLRDEKEMMYWCDDPWK